MKTFSKWLVFIFIILIITFIANIFISTGFFRTIENKFEGEIIKKIELPGAEDITISYQDDFALISSTDRSVYPPFKQEIGGIYFMNLKDNNYKIKSLTSDLPIPFAPHGISMVKSDSTYKVIAVNHTTKGHSLEVFKLIGGELIYKETLKDSLMVSPNDVVIVDNDNFYFTNDHKYTKGIGRLMEDYAGLALSNVVYFDGQNYQIVAEGIAYANGINFDAKRNLLYVASPRKFLIKVYSRNNDGTLNFIEDIPCGTGVDNIELDVHGKLWIGGHPNLLRFAAYAKNKEKTSPSEILTIDYRGLKDYSIEQIFLDTGDIMSSASVATSYKNIILTGNVKDNHFLVLKKGN